MDDSRRWFSRLLLAGVLALALACVAATATSVSPVTRPTTQAVAQAATQASTRASTQPATRPATQASSRPTTAAILLAHLAIRPVQPAWPKDDVQPFEIATEGEKAQLGLAGIETDLNAQTGISDVTENLSVLSTEISARADETTRLLASSPSLQVLRNLQESWDDYNAKLADWTHRLKARNDQLNDYLDQLDGDSVEKSKDPNRITAIGPSVERWKDTLRHILTLPPNENLQQMQQHIENTVNAIDLTTLHVKSALNHVHSLIRQVDDLNARVIAEQAQLKSANDDAFNRLLTRDNVPIWTLLRQWARGSQNVVAESQNSFWTQVRGLAAYAQRETSRFVLHAMILLVLTASLQYARHRIQQTLLHDPLLSAAAPVFQFPLLTSIVLTFFVSIWIYPEPPRLLWAIIGAAGLIPTVLILRQLVEKRLLTILYAMVAFYFVDQLRTVVASQVLISRLLFLIETAAASVFLGSFLISTGEKADDLAHGSGDQLWNTTRWAVRAAGLLLTVAFVANTIGFVSVSNLIGDATFGSAYLSIMIYAAVRLIDGLLLIMLRSRPLVFLALVRRNEPLLRARLSTGLHWAGALFWIYIALQLFWLWTPTYDLAHDTLFHPITIARLPPFNLHDVLIFGITVWASFLLSRLVRFALDEDIYGRFGVPSGTTFAINQILHYAILVAGFYLAVGASGVPTGQFTLLVSAFGVGLGFGLQNIVNNFVSGLILLFERPIKVGDLVQVGDNTGIVGHIGIRASVIRTYDGAEVIVPNGNLISANVTNWTLSNRQRGVDIAVSVATTADPAAVIDLLQKTAAASSMVTTNPPPKALLLTFTGDTYQFRLRAFTNQAERWNDVSSELSLAISAALKTANIPLK